MSEENNEERSYENNLDSLKERLMTVTSEIDAIKNSFAKSTEELARIQGLLNVGNVDQIGGVLEKYENKIAESERQKMEAAEGAKKYSEELEKEKERLIKLWDAYKNQEEELSNSEKKIAEFEEKAKTAEANVMQVEEDYNARIQTLEQRLQENEEKATQVDDFKIKCDEFDTIRNQLETEVQTLREENTNKANEIEYLHKQVEEAKGLEELAQYKDKYDEICGEYEKEKERLTKLYQLYEETDTECKRLKEENAKWTDWYNAKMSIFNQLFTNAPPVATDTPETFTPIDSDPIEVAEPADNKPKAKKKIRFKK